MDIAALSMAMSQASLAQNVGIQVMNIAKNQAETQSQTMVEMLGKSVAPNLGKHLILVFNCFMLRTHENTRSYVSLCFLLYIAFGLFFCSFMRTYDPITDSE